MASFKLSEVVPRSVGAPFANHRTQYKHFLEATKEYQNQGCVEVLRGTETGDNFHSDGNGFVNAVTRAYNRHHNLVIRPDDVWLAIMVQFGIYINANAEAMRSLFVDHQGKKELIVKGFGTLRNADYGALSKAMSKQLEMNVKNDSICKWVVPDFSTTTSNDIIVGSVVLMATLKSYFSYKFRLCCGIPYVTMKGTVEDWEEINKRVDDLKKYGDICDKWCDMLKVITTQFVETCKGKIDLKFWEKICHYEGGGSGPSYISGWISTFCVFNEHGKWQGEVYRGYEFPKVDTNDIPPGYLTVDVVVDDNGIKHETVMFAGHLGFEGVENGMWIAPKVAWGIALKDKNKAAKNANLMESFPGF